MEQYLLHTADGYYWIWYRGESDEKHQINGPHSDKMVNLPVVEVENPMSWMPPVQGTTP